MKISADFLKALDLKSAAGSVVSESLDRLPSLTIYRCFSDGTTELAAYTEALFSGGYTTQSETLTMPRRGFGPRPITIVPPVTRVLYKAVVERIRPSLPPSTREHDAWLQHGDFGLPKGLPTDDYVVDFDIASCYEYIDHDILRDQLISHSFDVAAVDALHGLLGETFGRSRGLPQLFKSSDQLADAYLQIIERSLVRSGRSVSRYADDFRVLASDWGSANSIIEDAAEVSRTCGLILSSEKTTIRKASGLLERQVEQDKFIEKYFEKAKDELTIYDIMEFDYDEITAVEVAPDDETARREGMRSILNDWLAGAESDGNIHARLVGSALRQLKAADERLTDEDLTAIVFRQPIKLQSVVAYLEARTEHPENWRSLKALVDMERQSPWAKVWLLHLADSQEWIDTDASREVQTWAVKQLDDRHEVVRSEAAWFLAGRQSLNVTQISELYKGGSLITRPALAAALSRIDAPTSKALANAIISESPANRVAFHWGGKQ